MTPSAKLAAAALIVGILIAVAAWRYSKKCGALDACPAGSVCVGGTCVASTPPRPPTPPTPPTPPAPPPGPPASLMVTTEASPNFTGVFDLISTDLDGYPVYRWATAPNGSILYRNPATRRWEVAGKRTLNATGNCCDGGAAYDSAPYTSDGAGPTDVAWAKGTKVTLIDPAAYPFPWRVDVATPVKPDFSGPFFLAGVDAGGYPVYQKGNGARLLYRNPDVGSWVVANTRTPSASGQCCDVSDLLDSAPYASATDGPTDVVWAGGTTVAFR